MAKKVERKYVSAGKGEVVSRDGKSRASGLRIGAVILWLLAIACEILAILFLNGTFFVPEQGIEILGFTLLPMTVLIAAIVADLILVIIGSQLWKKANHINPISKKNKVKFFLWNQMGLIVAVIAFMPLIIFLLKDKKLDAKTRKIVTVVAAIALVIASLASIDWSPVSAEELAEAQATYGDDNVYWTTFGKSYHIDENCHTLNRSRTIYYGTIEEAFEANRHDPCDFCVPQN
ncbi:MAG TPA: hypothetical protein PKV05_01790 [Bacillota bacterium]|nr:hypothetical protein [Bacillota bacterium]